MSRKNTSEDRRGPVSYAVLSIAALLTVAPFVFAVLGSFKTSGQLSANPLGLPDPLVWDNYAAVLGDGIIIRPLINSVVVGALTVAIVLVCGTLATFALSRFAFRIRESVYSFFTLGLLFPAAVAILPLYLMLRQLDLLNSPLGVALPQAAFALPVTIVILRPFFQAIPKELEEAAAMDGAGPMRFFIRILLPMAVPALITVSILALVTSWNGYLLPLLVLTDPSSATLPLGLSQFSGSYTYDTARVLAYAVIAMLPTILAYGVAERYIVQGLTAGAVKG
jgi:raffinose/stachyose/melibiose transport system permease protein